jgi:hypothetical protein
MLEEIRESTGIVPKALQRRPLAHSDCTKYRDTFRVLTTGRPYNQAGIMPLTVDSIILYVRGALGEDDYTEVQTYIRLMQSMDGVFLEHIRKKLPQ